MNPSERIQPILKTVLLIALGVFLYTHIANGTLYYYINERFAIFTVIGVVGLLILGLSYRWHSSQENHAPLIHGDMHHRDEHHRDGHHSDGHHSDGHDVHHHDHHGHSHALTWTSVFVIALPILLGLSISPQPLGTAALANRDVTLSMNESALPIGLRNREKAAVDKNIMDWWHDFRSSATAGEEFIGQEVRVVGFVFRDERFGTEHFLVTRFVVSCCVADANVLGLLVQMPNELTDSDVLKDDQWVEVQGTFVDEQPEGWQMPIVQATQIQPIAVPNQPYLYP